MSTPAPDSPAPDDPVPGASPDAEDFVYDEMAYFSENCAEYGLQLPDDLHVARVQHTLADGRELSALRWGDASPRLVLVHGGAQNAHTWDTVALALWPVPVLAIDLPGHGRSGWRSDGAYGPRENADDLAQMIAARAPDADVVVGMSLGGLTVTSLAARHPELVRRLVVVDVTPGVNRDKAADVHAFIEGPQTFPAFEDIFARTVEFNPTRTPASLRRGILHNAHRLADGSWQWNYDRGLTELAEDLEREGVPEEGVVPDGPDLWQDVSDVRAPLTLVRGALSPVVDDDDVAELLRRQPDAEVLVVDDAGHSIQGDRPLELAQLIRERLPARS
jgi:pimeloyl-ACP methyl ester carboxylesterase